MGELGLPGIHPIWITALLLIGADFSTYWVHRIYHESRVFWPFHSVHHSADVMTLITVFRKHPVYDLMSNALHGVIIGTIQGVLIGLFLDDVSMIVRQRDSWKQIRRMIRPGGKPAKPPSRVTPAE